MNEGKATRNVVVRSPRGLHLRSWELFAKLAAEYEAEVEVANDGIRADATSIINLMTLAAVEGTELVLSAEGPDAEQAIDALTSLIENIYEETDETETTETSPEEQTG